MPGPYKAGRPQRYSVERGCATNIPAVPGEYRIYTQAGRSKYVGETNNLRRRIQEHIRNGKLRKGQYVEYLVADGRSTSSTRRQHESKSIANKKPTTNKRRGGGGRKAQ